MSILFSLWKITPFYFTYLTIISYNYYMKDVQIFEQRVILQINI